MHEFSDLDRRQMARALALAAQGLYTSQPNPRVGCVIADGERVLGEGFHARAGQAHAEVNALAAAGAAARGATVYVTLEPCAHFGRTPPCADALIRAGVARVVVAVGDPFAQVGGRGLARLRAAGIRVDVGLLAEAAHELNCGFFSRIERGRPFVRLKMAASLDGRSALADGRSQWITGPAARADGQHYRARAGAMLTGIGTVLSDDPRLTVRIEAEHVAPRRVLLDRQLRLPLTAKLLQAGEPPLVYAGREADGERRAALLAAGVEVVGLAEILPADSDAAATPVGHEQAELAAVLADLARREVNELHVEAGARLSGALLGAGLVDELLIYQSGRLLGEAARPLFALPSPATLDRAQDWRVVTFDAIGDNWRLILRPAG